MEGLSIVCHSGGCSLAREFATSFCPFCMQIWMPIVALWPASRTLSLHAVFQVSLMKSLSLLQISSEEMGFLTLQ